MSTFFVFCICSAIFGATFGNSLTVRIFGLCLALSSSVTVVVVLVLAARDSSDAFRFVVVVSSFDLCLRSFCLCKLKKPPIGFV